MELIDTQVISYAYKKYQEDIYQQNISSITAKEFLLVQGKELTKANYYVPLLGLRHKNLLNGEENFSPRKHPFSKQLTDRIILEFGQDYPTLIDFSNIAIAKAINSKSKKLFSETVSFLDKEKRKVLRKRFNFMVDSDINCLPPSARAVELGLNLFYEFISHYNTKQNLRNTINDVLILATAIDLSATLITKDSLLNRFASEYYKGSLTEKAGIIAINFENLRDSDNCTNQESKGFINKGWQVRVRNYKGI